MNIPNIPIELIIAVLFFVLPALGSVRRSLRERRQRQASAERAPTPAQSPTTPTRADAPTRNQEGWLEEAQRRVREARQEEAAKRGRGGVNPRTLPQTPVTKPAPRPTRTPQAARPTAARTTPSLEGRTLEGRSLETYRPEHVSLESLGGGAPAPLTTAPPLRVQRLGGGGRATIARPLRFDERALMTGFIWSQVLSPPVSKRRTRLSRRQP